MTMKLALTRTPSTTAPACSRRSGLVSTVFPLPVAKTLSARRTLALLEGGSPRSQGQPDGANPLIVTRRRRRAARLRVAGSSTLLALGFGSAGLGRRT